MPEKTPLQALKEARDAIVEKIKIYQKDLEALDQIINRHSELFGGIPAAKPEAEPEPEPEPVETKEPEAPAPKAEEPPKPPVKAAEPKTEKPPIVKDTPLRQAKKPVEKEPVKKEPAEKEAAPKPAPAISKASAADPVGPIVAMREMFDREPLRQWRAKDIEDELNQLRSEGKLKTKSKNILHTIHWTLRHLISTREIQKGGKGKRVWYKKLGDKQTKKPR